MPQIEGLAEQQAALARIIKNLKKVEEVNDVLRKVWELSHDKNLEASYNILISFSAGSDIKKFKCPLLLSDIRPVLEAAQRHKEAIVAEVKKDVSDYRISLSPKESESLEWALSFE